MKSTEFLTQEHKLILRALDVLDAMSVYAEKSAPIDPADVHRILDFLRWFADGHHQAKEETILFPALKTAAASQGRNVDHLIFEHGQERSLVEELETAARLSNPSEFANSASRLSSLLRNHIYKEDQILFETIDTLLSSSEDDAVLEGLNRFETAVDKLVLKEKLEGLRSLEWKYLRR